MTGKTDTAGKMDIAKELGVSESVRMMEQVALEGEDTLIVALNYRCNNRCRFCMIHREIGDQLPDADRQLLQQVFQQNQKRRLFRRLTISGAEATLFADLEQLVRRAIDEGGFELVRIQTNGRKLQDASFAQGLVEAGLTEYFISVHAPDAALDEHITHSKQGFAQRLAGIANLQRLQARVITNTVICQDNYRSLPGIAELLLAKGITEANFWHFVEIGDSGQSDQHVRYPIAAPFLQQALGLLREAGVTLCVKWFPRCLLGPFADLLDNHQPQMLIRDAFQRRLASNFEFSCVHQRQCPFFRASCDGIHRRYLELFGDEKDHLKPAIRGKRDADAR